MNFLSIKIPILFHAGVINECDANRERTESNWRETTPHLTKFSRERTKRSTHFYDIVGFHPLCFYQDEGMDLETE